MLGDMLDIAQKAKELQLENEKKDKIIAKLEESNNFYAERENWFCSFSKHQDIIPHSDCDPLPEDERPSLLKVVFGGRLARQIKKEVEKLKND